MVRPFPAGLTHLPPPCSSFSGHLASLIVPPLPPAKRRQGRILFISWVVSEAYCFKRTRQCLGPALMNYAMRAFLSNTCEYVCPVRIRMQETNGGQTHSESGPGLRTEQWPCLPTFSPATGSPVVVTLQAQLQGQPRGCVTCAAALRRACAGLMLQAHEQRTEVGVHVCSSLLPRSQTASVGLTTQLP